MEKLIHYESKQIAARMSWLLFLILNLLHSEGFLTCDINPMVKVNCIEAELVKVIEYYMVHVNVKHSSHVDLPFHLLFCCEVPLSWCVGFRSSKVMDVERGKVVHEEVVRNGFDSDGMNRDGIRANSTSLSSSLMACYESANLKHGKFILGYIIKNTLAWISWKMHNYNYIATVQKPKNVTQMLKDFPVNGSITTLKLIRPIGQLKDFLLLGTKGYDISSYKFFVLYWDVNENDVITRGSHEISDHIGEGDEGFVYENPRNQVIGCIGLSYNFVDIVHGTISTDGDTQLELHLLGETSFRDTQPELHLLGGTSFASTLSYLCDGIVYVGSRSGGSESLGITGQALSIK
ncbi:Cleavage/polyadenylation specificity factor, A subunit, C-terminal [Artemisia annua]|uniref:Cleavage/polyadenylation specificity factor, A subunit, C-terminal n=1 Tax=Artemisia annua TaxID=35608 RepID=A0A2U1LQT0_ARTAN|nr:Cleavage/polyadenylation specificity factor, A subunit, C-terminal [Artemisia annua]